MPSRSSGSTVVRRRLGHALRALREDADIRIEAAARELECSTAKISRLENGLGPAKKLEVRALLDLYGVTDAERRAEFDRWADRTKSAGWWESEADVVEDDIARMMAVETESVLLRTYCTPVLPALLQSPAYSLAHVHDWYPNLSDDEVRRHAGLRQARQNELLNGDGSLRFVAVVDEGAVRREVGSAEIHREALRWLADTLDELARSGSDVVDLRILPFSAGTPGRAIGAFTVFTLREPELDPPVAYVEDSAGSTWYESPEDVRELAGTFEWLQDRSLDPIQSRALLRSLASHPDRAAADPPAARDARPTERHESSP